MEFGVSFLVANLQRRNERSIELDNTIQHTFFHYTQCMHHFCTKASAHRTFLSLQVCAFATLTMTSPDISWHLARKDALPNWV